MCAVAALWWWLCTATDRPAVLLHALAAAAAAGRTKALRAAKGWEATNCRCCLLLQSGAVEAGELLNAPSLSIFGLWRVQGVAGTAATVLLSHRGGWGWSVLLECAAGVSLAH